MSEDTGVSLLEPSTGLLDDADVTITSVRAGVGKATNDTSKQWVNVTLTYQGPDGKEGHEFYSAGDLSRLRPSPDGTRILPNADGAKLSGTSNAWLLISGILNAVRGSEDTKAAEAYLAKLQAAPDRLDNFDGLVVHVNRISKKQAAEGKDKPGTLLVVTRIVAFPGAKAKGTTTKAASKPAAKAPAAATSLAPPAQTTQAVEGADDAQITGMLIEAIKANGGALARNLVATKVFALAKAAGADWKAVMTRANQESFLTAVASEPHQVGDDVVVLNYDGKTISIAS